MVSTVADELRSRGERPAVLPLGGSNALAARGYVAYAAELEEHAPGAEHVVVAVGSGATMAGLVAGLGAGRVLGIDSGRNARSFGSNRLRYVVAFSGRPA